MAVSNEKREYTAQATADLTAQASRFRGVSIAGTLVAVNPVAGVSAQCIGILNTSARSGELFSYVYDGITRCVAGFAISTLAHPVMVGSSGYVFAAVSGGNSIGRALDTAASGDLFRAIVDFKTLAAWNGT